MFLKINNQHVGWKGDLVTCYNVTCKIKMYRARVMTSRLCLGLALFLLNDHDLCCTSTALHCVQSLARWLLLLLCTSTELDRQIFTIEKGRHD